MVSKLLLTATVLGGVSAQVPSILGRDSLERRQASVDPSCQSVLSDIQTIYADAPTPPADLASVTITDPCSVPTFTGKLGQEYSSYVTAAESWYTEHSKELASVVAACTQYASEATEGVLTCSSTAGVTSKTTSSSGSAAATTTSGATASGSSSASGSDSTASPTTGGASRETGFVAAAAMAIGLAGAVAIL